MDHEAEIARLNGVVADRDKMLAKAVTNHRRLLRQLWAVHELLRDGFYGQARGVLNEVFADESPELLPTSETDPW